MCILYTVIEICNLGQVSKILASSNFKLALASWASNVAFSFFLNVPVQKTEILNHLIFYII